MGPDWLNFLVMNIFLYFSDSLGKGQATKSDEFSESAKAFSIQKIILQIWGYLKYNKIDTKEEFQGMFFQQLY